MSWYFQGVEKHFDNFLFWVNKTSPLISAPGTCFPRGGSRASSTFRLRGLDLSSTSHRSQVPSAPINSSDVHVTPGNVHDSVPYLGCEDRQKQRFGFKVEAVVLDSGYFTHPICKGLSDRNIFGVIAHRRYHPTKVVIFKMEI
jgi:hypothetical protein